MSLWEEEKLQMKIKSIQAKLVLKTNSNISRETL